MLTQITLIAIIIAGVVSLLLPTNTQDTLYFHTQLIASGEYWRIITGHFIYTSWQHWLINTLGIGLFLLIFKPLKFSNHFLWLIIFLVGWISAGLLLFSEQLVWYVGFSGVLTGLYIYGACTKFNNARWLSIGIIILFVGFTGVQLYQGELTSGSIRELPSSSYAHALGITGSLFFTGINFVVKRITTLFRDT